VCEGLDPGSPVGYPAFHLSDPNLWVELDGHVAGGQPNERAFAQKLGYYAFRGMDFLAVESPEELRESIDARRMSGDTRQTKEGGAGTRT